MILTIDPSFRNIGWMVINQKEDFVDAGCIKTKKTINKGNSKRIYINEIGNIRKIATQLKRILALYNIDTIVIEISGTSTEEPHSSRLTGIIEGIILSMPIYYNTKLFIVDPNDSKFALMGVRSASKHEMMTCVAQCLGFIYSDKCYKSPLFKFSKKEFEHISDAYAAYRAYSKKLYIKI